MADRPSAAVVGGGPAGLIAAEVLATEGFSVTVFEHRPSLGRKLLLAGRGGLNLTHSEPIEAMIGRYDAPERVAAWLDAFGPEDLRAWCASLGEGTFVGTSGRVFPESFRATPLLRAWLARLAELGVRVATRHRWDGFGENGGHRFVLDDGTAIDVAADVTVLALGGASWPRVGSDGGWVRAVEAVGIDVRPLRATNVGVRVDWSESFVARFAGEPVKNVAVTVGDATVRGDPVVTATGLEAGPIYALSVPIREELDRDGRCALSLDLHPDQTLERLVDRLERRRPKDSVTNWLRRSIGLKPVMIGVLREATGNRLPDAPADVAALVKQVAVTVAGIMPIDRAISTAGGIALAEVDESLMLVRAPGTFVAGEMLDWEAPTGGYLLQASFSSGVVAARGASKWSRAARGPSRSLTDDVG